MDDDIRGPDEDVERSPLKIVNFNCESLDFGLPYGISLTAPRQYARIDKRPSPFHPLDVPPKSQYLQVRLSEEQKATLQRLARQAGQDVSAFVVSRCLPPLRIRFHELIEALRHDEERSFLLAELNDLLASLHAPAFSEAVADADLRSHSELTANYIAAMVEHTAARHGLVPPAWTRTVETLEMPYFATELASLRPWLLAASPVAFKRRNIFIDSTVGDRV